MTRSALLALVAAALVACGNVVLQSEAPEPACEPTVWMQATIGVTSTDPMLSFSGFCLDRGPAIHSSGAAACVAIEARHTGGVCACDPAAARHPVASEHAPALEKIEQSKQVAELDADCFCEIPQLTGTAANACENEPDLQVAADGVCYVDATVTPPIGNPQVANKCPANEQRMLRFVGKAVPSGASAVFVVCEANDCGGG